MIRRTLNRIRRWWLKRQLARIDRRGHGGKPWLRHQIMEELYQINQQEKNP